jgi:hypothetical protein
MEWAGIKKSYIKNDVVAAHYMMNAWTHVFEILKTRLAFPS